MFKKFVNWCKNLWARIKRAAKAAVEAFKEDPENTSDVIDVTVESEKDGFFEKAKTKVKDIFEEACNNPLVFSAKLAAITTVLSVPAKIIRSITGGAVTSIRDAAKKHDERTKFYDWNKPGTWYYTRRPMTKREMNYYSSQRDKGYRTPEILRSMGLLVA